jgi:hypothetical protein
LPAAPRCIRIAPARSLRCQTVGTREGRIDAAPLDHTRHHRPVRVRRARLDAVAHFAVFCNLGKRMQIEQHKLWLLTGVSELNRARRELDVALTLAPDFAGALAAKGEMLVELPGFLGGDPQEGERLLCRAIVLDPDEAQTRIMLASLLKATGRRDEARTHAAVALAILEHTGPSTEMDGARTLLAGLK